MDSRISSRLPFLQRSHVEEWAACGPPLREKPKSDQQRQALKDRKEALKSIKANLLKAAGENVSAKTVEAELDSLAQVLWDHAEGSKGTSTMNIPLGEQIDDRPEYQKSNEHPDNILDYRAEGGPYMNYLWCPKEDQIHGQSLYLGGEVGSDGNIYCIPGHAMRVLKIDTVNNTICPIGPELNTGNGRWYKWLRGIVVGDIIYGLPCHADSILRIDVKTQTVSQIDIPYEKLYSDPAKAKEQRFMTWKTHGGNICPIDGCIYAIPQSCHQVLKLDPKTETVSVVGPSFEGRWKWYGGIVGKQDGAIYGIPHNASGVLRIVPSGVTTHGDFGSGLHNWHGGAAAHNGVIVSVPANADSVLCVTPASTESGAPTLTHLPLEGYTCHHRDDRKYKYLGAMAGTNGKVYIFPCASEYVLEVDTLNGKARNVGPNLRKANMETVHQNKWQNGLTCMKDQCVYGMPLSGHTLLRIDCAATTTAEDSSEPIVTTWKLPSPRIDCKDKFEGGVYTEFGVMYTVPNNHKGVLRIEPAKLFHESN